jgi:hypothetical protein
MWWTHRADQGGTAQEAHFLLWGMSGTGSECPIFFNKEAIHPQIDFADVAATM